MPLISALETEADGSLSYSWPTWSTKRILVQPALPIETVKRKRGWGWGGGQGE